MATARGPGAAALALLVVLLPAADGQGLLAQPEQLAAGELAMARLFQSFEEALSFAPSVTGGKARPGRSGTGGSANPFSTGDKLAQLQLAAYYIAGAPDAFPTCRSMDSGGGGEGNPSATLTPRRLDCNNFVPAARDQRVCSTCVSTAVAAALQIAAASTVQEPVERWRVNAASLHYCSKALVGFRTCPIGWDIAEALGTVLDAQPTIVQPDSCLQNVTELNNSAGEVSVASWADICGRADQAMQNCSLTNSTGHFLTCTYKPLVTFHDIQRHVRRHGAVVSRILIPDDFEAQFANASNVPGEQAQAYRFNASATPKYGHAVVIVGYNNTARTWTILNSWGDSHISPDRKGTTADGTYRISMGLLGVGDQAYGVECEPAAVSPADPHGAHTWQRRDSKPLEFLQETDRINLNASCHLYRFNATADTVSSLVDHFGLGMLDFAWENTRVFPLQNITYKFVGPLALKELQDVLNTANSLLRPTGGIRPFVQCSHFDAEGKETVLTCTTNAADCTRLGANGTVGCALHYSAYDLSALVDGAKLRICDLSTSAFYRTARFDDVNASQRRALRDILQALGEEDVAVPEDSYCTWDRSPRMRIRGCTEDGWVADIILQDPQIDDDTKTTVTTISDVLLRPLLRLERLEYLSLYWFDGLLPPQLGALQHITSMDIGHHCAWGELPANWLDGWVGIKNLLVHGYSFGRFPPRQFAGQACGVTGSVPEQWSSAAGSGSLDSLNLDNNLFTGQLPPLNNMRALTMLTLSRNNFQKVLPPSWAKELASIVLIDLTDNPGLVGLVPREWSSMAKPFYNLYLRNTSLSGCLPLEFKGYNVAFGTTNISGYCSLAAAEREERRTSQAEAMATIFTKLFPGNADASPARYFGNTSKWYSDMVDWVAEGHLEEIRFSSFGNYFETAIGLQWNVAEGVPYVMGVRSQDTGLNLGHLGHFLSRLPGLELLRISQCGPGIGPSEGLLPDDLAQRAKRRLKVLEISRSRAVGTLPAKWGNWTTLREISLGNNNLRGPLPPSWGQMQSLQRLDLSGNRLAGPLPPEWQGMRPLAPGRGPNGEWTLNLSGKAGLNGTLPAAWGERGSRMPDGLTFDFSYTGLTGTIPLSYNRFSTMDLTGTRITGCIPPGVMVTGLPLGVCSSGERQAVKQLRNLLQAQTYSRDLALQGWVTPTTDATPYCRNKTGIQCDADNRVTKVDLPALRLNVTARARINTTTFFAILTGLPYLETLVASNMRLAGPLPALPVALPGGDGTSLGKLRVIDLSGNPEITGGLPPSWQALQELQLVDLSGCSGVTGALPEGWAGLQSLQVLRAANTGVNGELPPLYGLLASLQELDVSNARLSGPPVPSAWLDVLQMQAAVAASGLQFARDQLTVQVAAASAAAAVGQAGGRAGAASGEQRVALMHLKVLRLANNRFSGTLDPGLSRLPALRVLDLSAVNGQGNITGVLPTGLAFASKLQELSLSGQRLSGGLPLQWSMLSKLTKLDLARNQLSGPLPSTWSGMKKLRRLDLSGNAGLAGQVPASWLQLKWCAKVLLNGTGVTGC